MANTLRSLPDILIDNAITTLNGSALTSLDVFTKNFSDRQIDPLRDRTITMVTGSEATQTNATSFFGGAGVTTAVDVTMAQYTQRSELTNAQLQEGYKIEELQAKALQTFANKLTDVATTPITGTNFTNEVVVANPDDIDHAAIVEGLAYLPGATMRNAVLDWAYFVNLSPSDRDQWYNGDGYAGLSKFRAGRMAGAASNVVGFMCDQQAIAVCSALPYAPKGVWETRTGVIDSIGLPIQVNVGYDPDSRNVAITYDVCMGAALADGSAGVLYVDEATA